MEIIIKKIRNELKVSLEELEEDTGISKQRLSEIEGNKAKVEKILFIEMYLIADSLRKTYRRFIYS